MNKADLEQMVKRRPFNPVRIRLSNGETYDVTHPEGAMVSERVVAISVGDSITFVAMLHITEVVPLPAVSA